MVDCAMISILVMIQQATSKFTTYDITSDKPCTLKSKINIYT